MTTPTELRDELNLVSEYAGLRLEFEVCPGPTPGTGLVRAGGLGEYVVNLDWAMGNVNRLPDKASSRQMIHALAVSHPDVMGLSEKHPERRTA